MHSSCVRRHSCSFLLTPGLGSCVCTNPAHGYFWQLRFVAEAQKQMRFYQWGDEALVVRTVNYHSAIQTNDVSRSGKTWSDSGSTLLNGGSGFSLLTWSNKVQQHKKDQESGSDGGEVKWQVGLGWEKGGSKTLCWRIYDAKEGTSLAMWLVLRACQAAMEKHQLQ